MLASGGHRPTDESANRAARRSPASLEKPGFLQSRHQVGATARPAMVAAWRLPFAHHGHDHERYQSAGRAGGHRADANGRPIAPDWGHRLLHATADGEGHADGQAHDKGLPPTHWLRIVVAHLKHGLS